MARTASRSSATCPRRRSSRRSAGCRERRARRARTERLRLRRWTDADRPAFHALNADPQVMATIGAVMTRDESRRVHGPHRAALRPRTGSDCGASTSTASRSGSPASPCLGSATASRSGGASDRRTGVAATRPKRHVRAWRSAFGPLRLYEVISFTAAINTNSRRVMEKIGLARDADADFEHPSVPAGSPLRPHVLYRITRPVRFDRSR